jgi:hypothetical protein
MDVREVAIVVYIYYISLGIFSFSLPRLISCPPSLRIGSSLVNAQVLELPPNTVIFTPSLMPRSLRTFHEPQHSVLSSNALPSIGRLIFSRVCTDVTLRILAMISHKSNTLSRIILFITVSTCLLSLLITHSH